MDDLGDLARDLGFLPQRRPPPMAASCPNPAAVPSPNPNNTAAAPLFHNHKDAGFADDVFGGPPRPTNATRQPPPSCDKPVYDDDDFDIFDGVAGVKTAFSAKYDGASSSSPGPAPSNRASSSPYEDLLGSFAVEEPAVRVDFSVKSQPSNGYSGLDDLLPGFGGTTVESKSG